LRQECAASIRNSLNGILEYCAARLQQVHKRLGQFIRNRHLDSLYVLEMHIEGTFGYPSLAHDILDRYGFDRLPCIQGTCRAKDLLAGSSAFGAPNLGASGRVNSCHDGAFSTFRSFTVLTFSSK
jgi:hypothetical protein